VPAAFQLWFLRALLLLNLLYPLIGRALDRKPRLFFGVVGVLWLIGLELPGVTNAGLLFFSLGVWFARSGVDIVATPSWFRTRWMLLLWIALCATHTSIAFGFEQMNGWARFGMMLLYRGIELSGLLVAWIGGRALADWAMRRAWFAWLTGSSFVIYALHVPLVNYVTEGALQRVGTSPGASLGVYLVAPIAVMVFAVLVGTVLRAATPTLYGVLTGGRGLPAGRARVHAAALASASASPAVR
jgi:hypothetical protein